MSADTGSGHCDVRAFSVQPGRTDDDDSVARDALRLVDSERVTVIDPSTVEVVTVEADAFPAGELDRHRVIGEVDHGAAHAVVDLEDSARLIRLSSVVLQQHDFVAQDELPVCELHLVAEIESTEFGQPFPSQSVEEACLGARARQEQRLAGAPRCHPVSDGDRVQVRCSVGDDDPAVIAIRGERCRDVPVAQLVEGCLLPGLLLAAVHVEFGHPVAEQVDGCSERPACCDLRKLVVVANEDDLGPGDSRLADHLGEVARARHAGFIDDDHGSVVDGASLDEVTSDRRGVDPGACLEFSCGARRRGETNDRPTGVLVRCANGAESVSLARASSPDEERDPIT